MARIQILVLLIAAFITLVSAASPPTFCKCTCFKNSTIIPLGPESQHDSSSSLRRSPLFAELDPEARGTFDERPERTVRSTPRSASASCSECTKAFCLSQGIDFCKDAEEDDVVTMCFQRDSNKDKIIVWAFMVGTLGLLGWAAFKRFSEWRATRAFSQQTAGTYTQVGNDR